MRSQIAGELAQHPRGEGRQNSPGEPKRSSLWPGAVGIKHELSQPPADYGLSIALGFRRSEFWPLGGRNAYSTIANMGKYVPVTPNLIITDSEDNILYELDRDNTLNHKEHGDPAQGSPTSSFLS